MAKRRTTTATTTGGADVKVTMITTLAGPEGNARPGTVLDLPQAEAQELLSGQFARQYDESRDKSNRRGLERAKEQQE